MKILAIFAASAAFAVAATPAEAVQLKFDLTGDYTASWLLDSEARPNSADTGYFVIRNVVGNFPGTPYGQADLTFYGAAAGGGLQIAGSSGFIITKAGGRQLFSNSTSSPTLRSGVYDLFQYGGSGRYSLNVVPASVSAVPEPAAWALMIAGFGVVGAAMRRRHKVTTRVALA